MSAGIGHTDAGPPRRPAPDGRVPGRPRTGGRPAWPSPWAGTASASAWSLRPRARARVWPPGSGSAISTTSPVSSRSTATPWARSTKTEASNVEVQPGPNRPENREPVIQVRPNRKGRGPGSSRSTASITTSPEMASTGSEKHHTRSAALRTNRPAPPRILPPFVMTARPAARAARPAARAASAALSATRTTPASASARRANLAPVAAIPANGIMAAAESAAFV